MSEASLKISADNAPFIKAMKESQEAMAAAFEKMKGSVETISGAFEKLNGIATKFTAILAGGSAFKEIIESTVSWGESNIALSRALGISTERATVYQTAMQHLGIGTDVVTGASLALSKQIYNNSGAFEKAGIATKESNGQFRAVGDVMQDVINYLRSINDPIERNIAGMQLLGKGYAEYRSILKLTADAMQAAEVRAKELGLATNKEQIEEYKFAMRDVSLTVTSLQNELGRQLLPVLTNIGRIFSEKGPQDLEVFGSALKIAAYIGGTVAIEFQKMGLYIGAVMASIAAIGPGWAAADKSIKQQFDADIAELNKKADGLWDKLNRPPPKPEAEDKSDDAGPHDFDSKEASQPRTGQWQTALEEKKAAYEEAAAAQGQLLEFSKEQEIQYWQTILQTTKTTMEERKQIYAKIAADMLAIDKGRLEGSLATLKNEETAAGKNLEARLAAEMKYAESVKGVYGAQSKEYAEAQKAILDTKQQQVEQVRKLDDVMLQSARARDLAEITDAETIAQQQYDMGRITSERLLSLQRQFEEQKYQLSLKAAADELAIVNPNEDPVLYAQRCAQIEALAAAHHAAMLKIEGKAATEEMSKWKQVQSTITSSMTTAFESIIEKTATVHQAFTKMMDQILKSVVNVVAQIITKWVEQAAIALLLNRKQTLANASTAASGAMASAAAIPYIGWILAPIEGAAVYAAALGFSAADGFDIPSGLNPMTQLHAQEMVLPAKIAEPLRENLERGGGLGGGGFHLHTSNIDARSMERSLKRGGSLEKAMRDLHRRMKR